jgi:hypothetical protein
MLYHVKLLNGNSTYLVIDEHGIILPNDNEMKFLIMLIMKRIF